MPVASAPYHPQCSSIIILLQDQGLLTRKVGVPLGYGLAHVETGVGQVKDKLKQVFLLADNAEIPLRSR